MKIGIKDGKVYDICSDLRNKRDELIKNEDYLTLEMEIGDVIVGDTWDFENGMSLKDSLVRTELIPEIEERSFLKRINELEAKIKKLEEK